MRLLVTILSVALLASSPLAAETSNPIVTQYGMVADEYNCMDTIFGDVVFIPNCFCKLPGETGETIAGEGSLELIKYPVNLDPALDRTIRPWECLKTESFSCVGSGREIIVTYKVPLFYCVPPKVIPHITH
jgi:hypothetical protein